MFFSRRGKASELIHLIDAVTTNKTDFFGSRIISTSLTSKALPELAARLRASPQVADVERGLFHRRGAVYAGHGAERICGAKSRFSL